MQVIPDELNITTGYHVFETPDDVIINSQIYDKVDMKPKDYHFWNTNYCLNNKNLLLHEKNIVEHRWAKIAREPNYEFYIQDSQDSSIFYFLTEIGPSNDNQYVCKAKKNNNGYDLLNYISPDSGYSPFQGGAGSVEYSTVLHYKLIGQTNDYILVARFNTGPLSFSSGKNEYHNTYFSIALSYSVIKKSDFSIRHINRFLAYDFSTYYINSIGNYIYIYEIFGRNNGYATSAILKYDLSSNSLTTLYSINYPVGNLPGISNIIKFQNKYYVLVCGTTNYWQYAFSIFDINFKNDSVYFEQKVLDSIDEYSKHNVTNDGFWDSHWIQIDLQNIDDTYISVTFHDVENKYKRYMRSRPGYGNWTYVEYSYNNLSSLGWHRHLLFKYQDDNFIYKGMINPETQNQHIYGVLYLNQYTPIFFMNNKIVIYEFNLDEESYEKKFDLPGIYNTVGLDSNNNLYVFDQSNKCTIYNTDSSNELDVKFAKKEYKYNNENIYTYVSIYAKNILDSYINVNVKITLSGNCTFDDGSQELYTNTSESGNKNIPVTITYGGRIYCYIEEI